MSDDASDGKRPTRNMASSQLACVNFLLPLIDIPGALTAVLQAIDDDVTGVVNIEHEGTSSPVELEWIGLDHALEGPGVKSRGANSTSVDAFMVAETPSGRRAYLVEWKYVEEYRTEDKGQGRQGETRRRSDTLTSTRSPVLQRQGPIRRMALRALLPDPPPPPPRRPDGPQPRARHLRSKGRGRRPGGKPRVSGARDVTTARQGVPKPYSLRHRQGDARPPRPFVYIGLTVEPSRGRTKPVRCRRDGLGRVPPRPLRTVKGSPGRHAFESVRTVSSTTQIRQFRNMR